MEQEQPQNEFTAKEKLAFVGLVILAIAVIFLGYKQIQNGLKRPSAIFALEHSTNEPELQTKTDDQVKEELKQKDTDKDGLSDYEELYIYHTSPYLPDTDSDSITDKQEIEQGTDPSCPKGQNCGVAIGEIDNPFAAGYVTTTITLPPTTFPTINQLMAQAVFGGNPDPKILREFLIKQGVDKSLLDTLSDNELMDIFNQMITPTSTSATSLAQQMPALLNPNATSSEDQTNFLLNFAQGPQNVLDPKFLRQLLRSKGVTEEQLKQIDDKTLIEAAKQILKQ